MSHLSCKKINFLNELLLLGKEARRKHHLQMTSDSAAGTTVLTPATSQADPRPRRASVHRGHAPRSSAPPPHPAAPGQQRVVRTAPLHGAHFWLPLPREAPTPSPTPCSSLLRAVRQRHAGVVSRLLVWLPWWVRPLGGRHWVVGWKIGFAPRLCCLRFFSGGTASWFCRARGPPALPKPNQ